MSTLYLNNVDRLIQSLYAGAVDEGDRFRPGALERVAKCFGARGAVWLTVSGTGQSGEFSQWPLDAGHERHQLESLKWPEGARELFFDKLPLDLQAAEPVDGEKGFALRYHHRGADLSSLILLRFASTTPPLEIEALCRAVGHMVEAGTVSLRHYIQRDEWLQAMGRSNRGPAALVDFTGTVYAASQRFRQMVGGPGGDADFVRLPCEVPPEALAEPRSGSFAWNDLFFRVSRQGSLILLHVRAPLPLDGLSPREQEIARALGAGKTFKSVARQYDIAVSTVANHASRIYRKLGVYRREDLVQLVRKPGQDPRPN